MTIKLANTNDADESNEHEDYSMTYSVLHFAILTHQDYPKIQECSPPPSTVLYGKHAKTFADTICTLILFQLKLLHLCMRYKIMQYTNYYGYLPCGYSAIHHQTVIVPSP